MSGVMDLFGDWVTRALIWAVLALVLHVLAIHWGALLCGLRGGLGRALLAFLFVLVVAAGGRFFVFAMSLALPVPGALVLAMQLVVVVSVQAVAMLLLYRAELPRALLASFVISILGVALLTPVTLLMV